MAKKQIHMGVRQLVEFVVRSGSIDHRFGGFNRMQDGVRAHSHLQKQQEAGYRAEVWLSHTCNYKNYTFTVDGRADGIITQRDGVTIDEIKSTAMPFSYLHEDFSATHWAQVQCYGYFYCLQEGLDQIKLRLTYYQLNTKEIVHYERRYSFYQLKKFYLTLLYRWYQWDQWQEKRQYLRSRSLHRLQFPFPDYRAGQRAMSTQIYRTIQRGERLLCEAPTGMGKTVSALFPALKAMGDGMADRVFYLTARNTTHLAVEQALEVLQTQPLSVKSVTLTARNKICPMERPVCRPDVCPYADGFYDRINDVLLELLRRYDGFTREGICQIAEKYQLCPYELGLELSSWCDVIIGDYTHLFDLTAYLRKFFSKQTQENHVFLIDEAHNLLEHGQKMYSVTLSRSRVVDIRRVVKRGSLYNALTKLDQVLLQLEQRASQQDVALEKLPDQLLEAVDGCMECCERWLKSPPDYAIRIQVRNFYLYLKKVQGMMQLYGSGYVTDVQVRQEEVQCRLFCLDPSEFLDACMAQGRATVLFSATLSPMDYYQQMLGGGSSARQLLLPSPFSQKNLCLLVAPVDVRYARQKQSIPQVCDLLYTMFSARKGNYLAFFPSDQYLHQVYVAFCKRYPQVSTAIYPPSTEEQQWGDFLEQFQPGGAVLGFAVLGGMYAEGVDLTGQRLIGAAIISVGLPQLCRERDLLREYCEQNDLPGFEFAYQYPGMDRVLQAAGRVIRTVKDRGVVLLVDSRFTEERYQQLFPAHWSHWQPVEDVQTLGQVLHQFWNKKLLALS